MICLLFVGLVSTSSSLAQTLNLTMVEGRYEAALSGSSSARLQVQVVGDRNHDGIEDLLVTVQQPASLGGYLIFGVEGERSRTLDLRNLKSTTGIRLPAIPIAAGSVSKSTGPLYRKSAMAPAGTSVGLVLDMNQMPWGILPHNLVWYKDQLYFTAVDPAYGYELFRLEGNTPTLVKDVLSGPSSSWPGDLTVVNDKLVFTAFTPEKGRELYSYDGSQIQLISDLAPGSDDAFFEFPFLGFLLGGGTFAGNGSAIYFSASDGANEYLYKYDGTEISQILNPTTSKPLEDVNGIMIFNDQLLFSMQAEGAEARSLYVLVGGTLTQLGDMHTSDGLALFSYGSLQYEIYKDNLVFIGENGDDTFLYSYDGSSVTQIAASDDTGAALESYGNLTVVGDLLYFTADEANTGVELYVFDGTKATLVADLSNGTSETDFLRGVAYGGRLLMPLGLNNGITELYAIEGTSVRKWSEIDAAGKSIFPFEMRATGNTLYISAATATQGLQLWKIEGTTSSQITDVSKITMGTSLDLLSSIGGKLYLSPGEEDGELFQVVDGSVKLVADVDTDLSSDGSVYQVLDYGSEVLFTVYNYVKQRSDVFTTNGTTSRTIATNTGDHMALFNGNVYFIGPDPLDNKKDILLRYDGQKVEPAPNSSTDVVTVYEPFIVFKDKLFFEGSTEASGSELFSYDGMKISLAKDILEGTDGAEPENFAIFKDRLYFTMSIPVGEWSSEYRVYAFDGTNVTQIGDVVPDCDWEYPCLVPFGDRLFFNAETSESKNELHAYDGTSVEAITMPTAETYGLDPQYLTVYNDKLYFSGEDKNLGTELFAYDGSQITLVRDIFPGYDGSAPSMLTVHDGRLYFLATNPVSGEELHSLISGSGTAAEEPEVRDRFVLEQNYPNPASEETHISFTLPRASEVRLTLYDVLGRRVTVLVEGMFAAGRQTVDVPVNTLSAGAYFYQLEADGRVITRRMMVTR